MASKYLNQRQLVGVLKVGDILIPGEKEFPKFSHTGFINQIDRIMDHMSKEDLKGFSLLMTLFGHLPKAIIYFIMKVVTKGIRIPGILGAPIRLMNIGVKGVICTLYYSKLESEKKYGEKIYQLINWDAKIVTNITGEDQMRKYIEKGQISSLIPQEALKDQFLGKNDIPQAFDRARKSVEEIRIMSIKKRLSYITKLKKVILKNKEYIIDLIQKDTKKSRTDALVSEIFGVLDHLTYLEKFSYKILKDRKAHTPLSLMGKKSMVIFEPLGTVLIISPWNYPFYQAIVPITSAFITGNSVIYKPSELTPLKGLVEEVLSEAEFDPGWIQVIYGDGEVGKKLIDQGPDKIFFTGSLSTGRKIMAQAAQQIIPVELELGGKDPAVVFEDADLRRSVDGILWGALTNTGQSCTSVEKVYLHDSIYEEFKKVLISKARTISQSVDKDGSSDIGLMTSENQVEIIKEQLLDAKSKGAKVLSGSGWDMESEKVPPIILENITTEMKIENDESFGPFIPLYSFTTEKEVLEKINKSEYGLSASVWTADKKRALRIAKKIVTGNVSINNVMLTEGNSALPFGGSKKSGIGRFKGEFGLYSFSNIKSILTDSMGPKLEANWYPYTKRKYRLFSDLTDNIYAKGVFSLFKFVLSGLKLESYVAKIGKKSSQDKVGI